MPETNHSTQAMRVARAVSLLLGGLWLASIKAETILLPASSDNVVGTLGLTSTEKGDVLVDMGLAYSQGYVEMKLANPKVDPWLPGIDTEVVIPSQYVLPDTPPEGIVINLAEMRLYYYPRPKRGEPPVVLTYPVSVGRQDWKTPLGLTRVVKKDVDPNWYPPESIRAEHAADGDPLPKVVPAGPDNPLGRYALRLGHNGYLVHGTNKPYGIGMRVTHGCLRLYPKDIERLFHEVAVGTPVRIVNQPFKIGRSNGRLFLEVHPPFDEDGDAYRDRFTEVMGQITRMAPAVDWDHLQRVVAEHKGIPEPLIRRRAKRRSRSGRDF